MHASQESNWVSLSDMMTGLMLVFLLISILTISHVVEQQEKRTEIVTEFDRAKTEIYQDLKASFGSKRNEWGVKVAPDLSITFENPDVLFDYQSAELSPTFKAILDDFIPLYIGIINNPKYAETIKEVRIEGHTAEWDDYMYTISLSQDRSNAVLEYILLSSDYQNLTTKNQEKLKFWLIAAGLGKGRMVDESGEYTYHSQNGASAKSRRVEFRIVTTSDELIEEIINKL